MKNNTHGFILVEILIVTLVISLLFLASFKGLEGLKPQSGDSESEKSTYEEMAREAVSQAESRIEYEANMDPDKLY